MTSIDYLYPDVLGAITGGERVGMTALQFAVGAAPVMTYIGQPLEVVILLQNMVDQPLEVRISLGLPTRTPDGKPINLTTPRKLIALMMQPGEVGVARLPVVPLLPTPQPIEDLPIRVAVRQRVKDAYRFVRAPMGGAPPSELAVTPFQLQALRDVPYISHPWDQSPENILVPISVAEGSVPGRSQALTAKPRYTALWTAEQMNAEHDRATAQIDEARFIAADLMQEVNSIYPALLRGVETIFPGRGVPLKPGEGKAIAKILAYAFRDHTAHDRSFRLEDLRWFQTLCQVMAFDEVAARRPAQELVMRYLFDAALYDAVLFAYSAMRPRLRIDLGNSVMRIARANSILTWQAGHVEPDPVYIYMPLALGGLSIHVDSLLPNEDAWTMVDELREAYRQRVRLDDPSFEPILDVLDRLLTQVETELRENNVKPR